MYPSIQEGMGAHLFIFNQLGQRTNGMGNEKYGMEKLLELLAHIEANCRYSIYYIELKYCYEQGIGPQCTIPGTP